MNKDKPVEYYSIEKSINDLKYVELDGNRIHVSEFEDESVTIGMINNMKLNMYGRGSIPPKLTDEALVYTVKHFMTVCEKPMRTASDYLIQILVPELIKRIEKNEGLEK
ncbi:hypothetical protein [Rossellomorea marisflavi]|uniref:hypothetical protein n=1 Tax=Rossellomorea marisflavi TaxID=189381 RepID=UPI003FA09FB9